MVLIKDEAYRKMIRERAAQLLGDWPGEDGKKAEEATPEAAKVTSIEPPQKDPIPEVSVLLPAAPVRRTESRNSYDLMETSDESSDESPLITSRRRPMERAESNFSTDPLQDWEETTHSGGSRETGPSNHNVVEGELQKLERPKGGVNLWEESEDRILLKALADGKSYPQIALLLPKRNGDGVKKRAYKLRDLGLISINRRVPEPVRPASTSTTSKTPSNEPTPIKSPVPVTMPTQQVPKVGPYPNPLTINTTTQKRKRDVDKPGSSNGSSVVSAAGSPKTLTTSPTLLSSSRLFGMGPIPKKPKASSTTETPESASASASASDLRRASIANLSGRPSNSTMRQPKQGERAIGVKLSIIRDLIQECQDAHAGKGRPRPIEQLYSLVLGELHELEFVKVPPIMLAQIRLLDNNRGLPQIFDKRLDKGVEYPQHIRDDAKMLFNRWTAGEYEHDLYAGITNLVKVKGKTLAPNIDPTYEKRQDPRYFGNKNLLNGQWWPSQLCAVRDGAHGSTIAGIYGIKGKGACSVVLSGDTYSKFNKDEGNEIEYSGVPNTKPNLAADPTEGTQLLLDSIESKEPVRVMRSSKLPSDNQFKPAKGFRFDGLYDVLGKKIIDGPTQHYLFHLKRRGDQAALRCHGDQARPTKQEIHHLEQERKKYGIHGPMP